MYALKIEYLGDALNIEMVTPAMDYSFQVPLPFLYKFNGLTRPRPRILSGHEEEWEGR